MLTVLRRHEHFDWQSTKAFLYVIGKSIIILTWTWTYIIVLDISEKTQFQTFYYIHVIEIPTNKGANSLRLQNMGISWYW